MTEISNHEHAVELLQQLGLKEYEAKSFVALVRLPTGTAKEISEISDVPRTRVYDAIRVLETKGLVEVQHSSPQQFRAVGIDEAVETLRNTYEERTETLRETLRGLEAADVGSESQVAHEIWGLAGETTITHRTQQLVDDATQEVVLVLGTERVYTDQLAQRLQAAHQRDVRVIVGTDSEQLRDRVLNDVPGIEVFVSELEWLHGVDGELEVTRLLLVDRSAILVSTETGASDDGVTERAVFGEGFENGLVVIARRLMATGLLPGEDPGIDGDDLGIEDT